MMISASPLYGKTKSLSVTDTSGSVTLAKESPQALVTNNGDDAMFCRFTAAASTAVAGDDGDLPVLPGTQVIVNKPPDALIFSAVAASGETATAYVTPMFGA